MRVSSLGQLRVSGRIANEYSNVSKRPYPYKSEDNLIDEGIETNLIPPWGDMPGKDSQPAYTWPDYVKPPNVPSLEEEVYSIRRTDSSTIYPWAGTWNDNRLSTKELKKTTYPKSPVMAGLGQMTQPEKAPMAVKILMIPVLGALSYASFRAVDSEKNAIWKTVLAAGGALFGLGAVCTLACAANKTTTK